MRIAFLTRNYPPDSLWGGDAVVYDNLARGLARRGHEVHVVCQATGKPGEIVQDGVFVHRVGTNPQRYSVAARLNYSLYSWARLRRIIDKRGIQIVDAPDWSAEGFLYSLHKQTPLVVTAVGSTDDPIRSKNYAGFLQLGALLLLRCLRNLTVRRADKVIAISQDSFEAVLRRYAVDHQRVVKVPLGIDTDKFRPAEPGTTRAKLGLPNDASIVTFVGRLEARNGVHLLCQAIPQVAARLPDTRFVFVGRDTNTAPEGGSFRRHIANCVGESARFINFLPDEELVQLYSASDVCVYPALTSTFGLPIAEAMACGKPVVSTPVGIARELEPYASGGLTVVAAQEPRELAEAIVRYLTAPKASKDRIAKSNRDLIESRFSIPLWVDQMSDLYAGLLVE
jgi:glycosyltransferase involved in cell wall biosynthesis